MGSYRLAAVAVVCGASTHVAAQEPLRPASATSLPTAPLNRPAPPPCQDCALIPALTAVRIQIDATVGSKISKTGDTFPISLAEPILVNGQVVIPAGATGLGEVIHAKKSGGSGAAGELVLAARYLDIDGHKLRLRSLHLSPIGKSNMNTVNAINIASAASPLPIGMLGFFITGGQATVAQGSLADAKTAEDATIPVPRSVPITVGAARP